MSPSTGGSFITRYGPQETLIAFIWCLRLAVKAAQIQVPLALCLAKGEKARERGVDGQT